MPPVGTYRSGHPEHTPFYQCLEDYWEEFQEAYPYFYERDYGPWSPVLERTVERFLQCGILSHGFARLRCSDCRERFPEHTVCILLKQIDLCQNGELKSPVG